MAPGTSPGEAVLLRDPRISGNVLVTSPSHLTRDRGPAGATADRAYGRRLGDLARLRFAAGRGDHGDRSVVATHHFNRPLR